MSIFYNLQVNEGRQSNELSFIGGKPHLPLTETIPTCILCASQLTFYFQVTFPVGHQWNGLTMCLFSCTKCHDNNYLIPEMLSERLKAVTIPDGFIAKYQRNFRTIMFDTSEGILNEDYEEKIAFKRISFVETSETDITKPTLGGEAIWLLEDETPANYEGEEMFFLLQLPESFKFDILPDAKGQIKYSFFEDRLVESEKPYYELFLGNIIYLFGTLDKNKASVYIVTQI